MVKAPDVPWFATLVGLLFWLVTAAFGPLAFAHQADCGEALSFPLTNYRRLVEMGLRSGLFPVETLNGLTAEQLNPLSRGLNAQQRQLKASLDQIIVSMNKETRSLAVRVLNEIQSAIQEKRTQRAEAEDKSAETQSKIIFETSLAFKNPVERTSMYLRLDRDRLNGLSILNRNSFTLQELDATGFLQRTEPGSQGRFLRDLKSAVVKVTAIDGSDRLILFNESPNTPSINITDYGSHGRGPIKKWTVPLKNARDLEIQAVSNFKGEVFFAIHTENEWRVGELTDHGPIFGDHRLPKLGHGRFPDSKARSLGTVFTESGAPRYFGLSSDNRLEHFDGRTGILLDSWSAPKSRNNFLYGQPLGENVIFSMFQYSDGTSRGYLNFFVSGQKRALKSHSALESPRILGWIKLNDQAHFAVSEKVDGQDLWAVFTPLDKNSHQPLAKSYARNLISRTRLSTIRIEPSRTFSVPLFYSASLIEKPKFIKGRNQHFIAYNTQNGIAILKLDSSFKVLDSFEKEIEYQGEQEESYLFDEETDQLYYAVSDFQMIRVFNLQRTGPILIYENKKMTGPATITPLHKLGNGDIVLGEVFKKWDRSNSGVEEPYRVFRIVRVVTRGM